NGLRRFARSYSLRAEKSSAARARARRSAPAVRLPTAVVLDDGLQNLVERDGGAEARERADLRDVWDAARHVLEAFLVCLVVGDCDYLGVRAGQLAHAAREFHDRDLLVRADVEDLAHRLVPF